MSELAIPTQHADLQPYQDANVARLAAWAQQADAAVRMADVIAGTAMCPLAYRGKPNEAAAAILAGAEVGLSPMASLRAFDNIQGTPAPKAITLRAVVQGLGHEVRIVTSDEQRAEVAGRRKGDTDWQTSVWTIQRADQMGLAKKEQWQKQPAAMLVARATAEVCRWIASDAIMGMPYAAEEIADTTGMQAAPPTQRVTAAEIVGAAVEHVEQQRTVDAPDAGEVLSRIRHAATQSDLDKIRDTCLAAGLLDTDIKQAWADRSAELAEVTA